MALVLEATAVDHVGIAATASSTPLTALLGAAVSVREMSSGVAVGRFGPHDALEVVLPHRDGSPIGSFLSRRGPGLHHVGLRVDEPLGDLLPRLAAAGVRVVGAVEPSADGRPSLFIHPSSTGGVLVELVEGPRRA
jgi:methylmalonyl-CoA/ethylmalonyl-CoA epimerase